MWFNFLGSQSDPGYHTCLHHHHSESQTTGGRTTRLAGFSRIWVWGQAGAGPGSTREGSRVGAASGHRAAFQGEQGPTLSSCGITPGSCQNMHTGFPFPPAEPVSSDPETLAWLGLAQSAALLGRAPIGRNLAAAAATVCPEVGFYYLGPSI